MAADAGAVGFTIYAKDAASASIDKVVKNAKGLATSLAGAFAAVKVLDFVSAYGEAEAAIDKLNLTLSNQGNYTDKAAKDLGAYASQLQATTRFSDDAALAAETLLASFGQTGDEIQKTTASAADLAAGLGIGLEDAAQLLGKAYAGNTTALQKMGFQIDSTKKGADQFADVLEKVNTRFGGNAARDAETFAGGMEQLKNAYGEVEEAAGKLVVSMFDVQGGVSGAKNALLGLADFLSHTLVAALQEARAMFSETIATFSEEYGRIASLLSTVSAKAGFTDDAKYWADQASGAENYANALQDTANVMREAGVAAKETTDNFHDGEQSAASLAAKQKTLAEASKIAGHEVKTLAEANSILSAAHEKAAKAAAQHAADIKKLTDALSDAGRAAVEAKSISDIDEAIAKVGGATKLSQDELMRFADALRQTGTKGAEEAHKLVQAWQAVNVMIIGTASAAKNIDFTALVPKFESNTPEKAHAQAVSDAAAAMKQQINDAKELAQVQGDAAAELLKTNQITGSEYDDILGKQKKSVEEQKKAAETGARWNAALQGASMLTSAIGGQLGDMVGIVGNIAKSFEGWGDKLPMDKFAAIAGAVGQIGSQIGGTAGSAITGAAGGALSGAAIGGPIGAVVGGVVGLIGGIFAGKKKKAEELKKKQDEAIKGFSDMFDQWIAARKELAAKGAEGVNSLVTSMVDKDGKFTGAFTSAANAADYVAASFAALRASGMSTADALAAISPALDAMKKNPDAFANSAATPLLQMAKFAEANASLFQFTQGLGLTAQALSGFGLLTQDLATKMSMDMGGAIDRMVAGGLSYQQALALSAQDLYNLKMAAESSGVALDEHTQKMVDDAEAAGLFKNLEDPMKKLVDINGAMVAAMGQMVQLLGGQVPAAVQKMIDEFNSAKLNVNVDVNVNGTSSGGGTVNTGNNPGTDAGKPGGKFPSYADGSRGMRNFGTGTLAMLHGPEAVVTAGEYDRMMHGGHDSTTPALLAALQAQPANISRAIRDALARVIV